MKNISLIILSLLVSVNASALDLTLKECREMALKSDENLKIAENNLEGANLDRAVARTQYFPKFAGNATAIYSAPDSKIGDMMTLQMRGAYMAGINLTQPIYAGGKIVAANKMASVGQDIYRQQLRATRMDVIADAEKTYWTYVGVLEKVEMTKSYLALMDSIYEMTNNSVEIGMTNRQSLLRVNTRRSEILYRLNQAQAGADICRMALCRVIGVSDTTSIHPTESIVINDILPLMNDDVSNRPEAIMLDKNIEIKKHEVTMTRADFLPVVGLQLGWSAYGNLKMKGWSQDEMGNPFPYTSTTNDNGFSGILSVQIPLFHWGEGIKKVRHAKLDVENARLSLQRNTKLMQLEARQNYSNIVTGLELITSADKAMNEANENLRMMREQYEVGLNTLTDLLEAQSQWQSSYSNLIEAQTQYRINQVEYLRSIGELE
ncbi:MAG: TolC family protein [Muribaculaceae bacterium]|nr:TolC family protein [Muribaculaceae bacterium]